MMKRQEVKSIIKQDRKILTLSGKVIEVYQKNRRYYSKILITPNPVDLILEIKKKMNLGDKLNMRSEIMINQLTLNK